MKKKKKLIVTPEEEVVLVNPTTGEEVPATVEEEDEDTLVPEDVEAAMDEIGEDISQVMILRRSSDTGKMAYRGIMAADEFSLESVRNLHGGGVYLVRFRNRAGKYVGSKRFEIDAPPPTARPASASGGAVDVASIVREVMRELRPQQPQENPLAVLTALGPLMLQNMQTMMAALMPLMQRQEPLPMEKAIAFFEKGVEAAEKAERGDEGYGSVLRDVGKPLVEMLTKLIPAQPGAAALPTPKEARPVGQTDLLTAMGRYVPKLVSLAARGDEPDLWATLLDREYPQWARMLETVVAQQGVDGIVVAVTDRYPVLQPHKDWLRRFLTEFIVGNEVTDEPDETDKEDEQDE